MKGDGPTPAGARRAQDGELGSHLLSMLSHELRTPLNSILGFTELLKVRTELTPVQERYVDNIRRSGEQLLEVLSNLIDLAGVSSGSVEVALEPVELRRLAAAVAADASVLAAIKGLALDLDIPAGLAAQADPRRLRQVLHHLVGNAIRFSASGWVRVTAHQDGLAVALAVEDSGIGIAPEHLDRVFDDFFQVDSGLRRRVGGNGVGLPLCRRLIELMGGTLDVASTPGEGSRFTLILPCPRTGADLIHP